MGLPASQVIGTFGERGTSGSNVNGVYANLRLAPKSGRRQSSA